MKQTAMDSDVLFLPHEIIRNILKRLPVKSLIRFQCVCKDWKNLMQNPSFIVDHLQQSSHQNPSLLLECKRINIPLPWRLYLLDSGLQVRRVQNSPSNNSSRNAGIVGSCNGLLCLEIHDFNQSPHPLSLWNPATTAVRHVPRTITDFCDFYNCVTGFGFSPIVNDYKIVRTYAVFYDVVTKVEVFSLNRGTWKAIDIGNLKGVRLNSETVTANGAIFWSGVKLVREKKEGEDNIGLQEDEDYIEEAEDKVDVIVSFDIAKEVFTVIPRPNLDWDADVMLTVYENKLAILCDIWGDEDEIPDMIYLWVLDEGTCASGDTWSWTKRYTSSPLSCTLDSMAIWRNEIVCKPDSEEHDDKGRRNVLCMMNLTTNEVKRSVISYCDSILRIYNYVESLVSVGNNYIEES
ncbi:hypothetical protein QN277_009160 [Acacia crassicarpa]|uniref:F-box domain-containing protein n=1 Tax=Acacia crassicarpa TaxID=499986 RepID=A0AAE1ISE1_9FABA|nr:hypothetical protein QN277_009160 [Acacia crassicarpa]